MGGEPVSVYWFQEHFALTLCSVPAVPSLSLATNRHNILLTQMNSGIPVCIFGLFQSPSSRFKDTVQRESDGRPPPTERHSGRPLDQNPVTRRLQRCPFLHFIWPTDSKPKIPHFWLLQTRVQFVLPFTKAHCRCGSAASV